MSDRPDAGRAPRPVVWVRRVSLWGSIGALVFGVVELLITWNIWRAAPMLVLGLLALCSVRAISRWPHPASRLARVELTGINAEQMPDIARDALLACCRVRRWIVPIADGTGIQGRTDLGVRSFGEWVTVTWQASPQSVTIDIKSGPWFPQLIDWGKNAANVRRVAARLLDAAGRAGAVEVPSQFSRDDASH